MSLEYKILEATMHSTLVSFVNEDIKKGWVPQGGLAIEAPQGNLRYYQAMVRENVNGPERTCL